MRLLKSAIRISIAFWALCGLVTAGFAAGNRPVTTLRVGVVVGENVNYRLGRMEPFRLYLEGQLNRSVTIEATRNYQALLEAHAKGRIHYAVYSAAAYAKSWAACRCLEPLAAPKSLSGGHGIRSVLIVADDAPYKSVQDLNNKRVLYTAPSTLAGHLVPARAMSMLSGNGNFIFGDADVAKDVLESLSALKLGNASAIFGWQGSEGNTRGTISSAEQRGLLEIGSTRVIWQSEFLPHGPHAVLDDLPQEIIDKLRAALLRLQPTSDETVASALHSESLRDYSSADVLEAIDANFGGGFAAVDHYDYLPILNILGWGTESIVPAWP
ncbi:MAG: PhnD/SsuA/transferrin family substrate-binding protein [Hyphomicrobiales bacterium]